MIDFSEYTKEYIQEEMLDQVDPDIDTREGSMVQTAVAPGAWFLEGSYLTLAQMQMIEIIKAVSCDAKIIIMDEPTSSLTETETDILFGIIRKLREKGVAIVFISHKLAEIKAVADRVSPDEIIKMIIDELSANGYTGYDSDYDHNYDYDYDYESHGEEDFKWGSCLLASFIAGLVVAFIVTAVFKGQLKSVKQQTRAENYVVDGSMKVTEASDLFLYRHVTRTARPKNNGGNSSGSHRSSSGRSHGGRGGSFR